MFYREVEAQSPRTYFFCAFSNHPFHVRSYKCTILEQLMQNGYVVELKVTSICSQCNMKRTPICGIRSDVEVVLYEPIDDELFQRCPKLTRPLFRLRFSCREGLLQFQCVILEVFAVVMSTTVCIPTGRILHQQNEIA